MRCPKSQYEAPWNPDAAIEDEPLDLRPYEVSEDGVADQEEPKAVSDSKAGEQRQPSRLRGRGTNHHVSCPTVQERWFGLQNAA
jgi:hypothetical protein